ncbi:hypothetical protein MKW92_013296 [Papaver armeniacum]|nr:hypothetical protein MKW92_013296 [Papaver armeniacum]
MERLMLIQASHSSKVADENVGGSRKRKEKSLNCKSHCSTDREKRVNSPQELDFTMKTLGFFVLHEYKDLYTRVIASKWHMASDTKVKSMFIQATMMEEARRAYEAVKVEKAELIAKVGTVKASLTSLSNSALGSCLRL